MTDGQIFKNLCVFMLMLLATVAIFNPNELPDSTTVAFFLLGCAAIVKVKG